MGDRPPTVSARDLIRVLEGLGFRERALTATSHRRFVHPDGRKTTVPVHKGKDIGRGLLRKILRDVEITSERFIDLL